MVSACQRVHAACVATSCAGSHFRAARRPGTPNPEQVLTDLEKAKLNRANLSLPEKKTQSDKVDGESGWFRGVSRGMGAVRGGGLPELR